MKDIAALFREYARLDLTRQSQGLSIAEHERWATLKAAIDLELGRSREPLDPTKRRSAKRVETRLRCSYAAADDGGEAVVSNLSTGGVFIRTDWPLPIETEIRLTIRLEDTGDDIVVRGVVVSNNVDARFDTRVRGMGVRFVQVEPLMLERLSALYSEALLEERGGGVPRTFGSPGRVGAGRLPSEASGRR